MLQLVRTALVVTGTAQLLIKQSDAEHVLPSTVPIQNIQPWLLNVLVAAIRVRIGLFLVNRALLAVLFVWCVSARLEAIHGRILGIRKCSLIRVLKLNSGLLPDLLDGSRLLLSR